MTPLYKARAPKDFFSCVVSLLFYLIKIKQKLLLLYLCDNGFRIRLYLFLDLVKSREIAKGSFKLSLGI